MPDSLPSLRAVRGAAPSSEPDPAEEIGYARLLRSNRDFRNLWLAQVVSQVGDWFSYVGLSALLLEATGSGEVVGGYLVARTLPAFLLGPTAGAWVDRLPRRAVMIASDVLRAGFVLLLLSANDADDVGLIYGVSIAIVSAATFFEPARAAVLPQVCTPRELVAANALSGATWSTALAVGATLGGLVASLFGLRTALIIDAGTFLLSAALVARVRVPPTAKDPDRAVGDPLGLRDFFRGMAWLAGHRDVAVLALLKAGLLISGANLVVLTVLGEEVFAADAAALLGAGTGVGGLGIGLLYTARGVGAGVGSVGVHKLVGSAPRRLRWAIGIGYALHGGGYLLMGLSTSLPAAMACAVVAHCGGAIVWVYSGALLQTVVPNHLLGRATAAEMGLMTLVLSASSLLAGHLLDGAVPDPRELATLLGFVGLIPALLWSAAQPAMGGRIDERVREARTS